MLVWPPFRIRTLLLLIGMVVRHELHRKPRLLGGKLPAQGLVALDDPQPEGLCGIQQGILIAVLGIEPGEPERQGSR